MRQRPVALKFRPICLCILGDICCHRVVQLFFLGLVSLILTRTLRLALPEFLSCFTVFDFHVGLRNLFLPFFSILILVSETIAFSGPIFSLSSSVTDELELLLLMVLDEDTDDDEG